MDSHVGKLTNPNSKVTKSGYMRQELLYQLHTNNVSMDDLYDADTFTLQRYIGNQNVDELKKFLGYIPKLELSAEC